MPLHIIALGNEKGGTGKSTTAVHIGVALAVAGLRTAMLDLDSRQRTSARYLENRVRFAATHGLALPTPDHVTIADGDAAVAELHGRIAQAQEAGLDVLIIDTPGRDSLLARAALGRADTIITPINDSFIDFDLIGEVDPESYAVKKPGFYAGLIFEARQARARHDGGSIDWVVLRNRLATLDARNRKRVGAALETLARRIGFRHLPGLSERVIFREFFPRGLTLLDRDALEDFSISHVGARAELRAMIAGLNLPGVDPARLAA